MKRVQTPITGTLRSYAVQPGDDVSVGQEVAIVESMKMMIPVLAEQEGKVRALVHPLDQLVHEGDTLIELE